METEMLGDNATVIMASDRPYNYSAMMEGINSKMAEAIGRNRRTDSIQEALRMYLYCLAAMHTLANCRQSL